MKLSLRSTLLTLMVGASSMAMGCSSADAVDDDAAQAVTNAAGSPKLCAALRGNGPQIVTHFVSLARIIEHYGVVDGMSGGSSGSITTFFYESILKNPVVSQCGTAKCTETERAARVSLALKSLEGYGANVASKSQEGVAVGNLIELATRLKKEVDDRGIGSLVSTDTARAAAKLTEVLQIPELTGLVNPELFAMLRDTAHLEYNVKEVYTSIVTFGQFSVENNRFFFRPGAVNWDAVAVLFGRVADFYAGYSDADTKAQAAWLDACAAGSVDKPWKEAEALSMPSGGTCGDAFAKIESDYLAKVRTTTRAPQRLSEHVGDPAPLKKIVTTGVLEGSGLTAYAAARKSYFSGQYPAGNIPLDVSWNDVKFGYWGDSADLAAITKNVKGFTDSKSTKATSLGNGTWKEVLTSSPAEPGLSHFVALPDGRMSLGGWADLSPTLVLKSAGCERVVYVTREGDESEFSSKIAMNLGMKEADWKALSDLSSPESSYSTSIEKADAVWCTEWNSFTSTQQREMAADAWKSPLETHKGFAGISTLSPYDNTTSRTGKAGCTPGVSGGAKYPH